MSSEPRAGADRRAAARRARRRDESWFGALAASTDNQKLPDDGTPESRIDLHPSPAAGSTDSRFLSRQAQRLVVAGQNGFHRIYRAFLGARAVIGVVLALAVVLTGAFGTPAPASTALISLFYAAWSISAWLLVRVRRASSTETRTRLRPRQYVFTVGIDIACFIALHLLSDASNLNFVALLVLPVLMAGVLTSRLIALATAAAVTLGLLGVGWLALLTGEGTMTLMTQTGLAGSGFFVITILASEMASRLAREERAAKGSLELARQQAQLNRLVIDEMQEGVLVVDRRGRVRSANPAARELLVSEGIGSEAPFPLRRLEAWSELVCAVERAFTEGLWPEAGRDVALRFDTGLVRTLRLRMRFTRRADGEADEELCVLFMDDVLRVQARIRQEKLAAMGRVSAGIAHEIRNPLAAIAQANALMAEDATTASQRQLTRMVSDNVERLKRIVDDVMEVAPAEVHDPGVVDVCAQVAAVCSEWARTVNLPLGEHSVLRANVPDASLGAVFDAEHLRRVLINLLDNAHRHASKSPGSVAVTVDARDDVHVGLSVRSDGDPIPPDVERYLFEPFFSTRSRGTGLGLYICRELCERYRARIDYRLRPATEGNRNEFFVAMRRAALPAHDTAEARLHLDS